MNNVMIDFTCTVKHFKLNHVYHYNIIKMNNITINANLIKNHSID